MKKTPWFPAHVQPVRPGVYECGSDIAGVWYRYFDGARWHFGNRRLEAACAGLPSPIGRIPIEHLPKWRGLAAKP